MTELTRRRMLQGILALGLAPLAGCGGDRGGGRGGSRGGSRNGDHSPILLLLHGLLQEVALPDPLQVGRAHLQNTPTERDPSLLLEAVFADLPLAADLPHLRRTFAQRLREEFTHQQTITTDGWLLALSESRFCALLAICHALSQASEAFAQQAENATALDR